MGPRLSDLLRERGPRAPRGQSLSLFLGLASALLLALDPALISTSLAELRQPELLLLVTAITLCLLHGLGPVFRPGTPGRWLAHPFTAWSLLALAWWKLLH
ncbi:cyd operon YbgE family protein [Azovibrio restrictus]|uniref:cyd operon YbgE family protein n=1 Tax=Azovibrio restrictus TaxID=146938 RepID=UPI0026EB9316|nr:cyd operon YbgE family protein [Azovibrio restrictus]MDD3483991.1 cyd operon YbgE family protein [Azovibrio restrictus]